MFVTCQLFLAILFSAAQGDGWNYHENDNFLGPYHWVDKYQTCNGTRQSPVDIKNSVLNNSLARVKFQGYDQVPPKVFAENVGHTVNIYAQNLTMAISNGSLGSSFTFVQMHFHWGANDSTGSEHSIDGVSFPLELHFVHWNSVKYASFQQAANESDGLAALAVLVQVAKENVSLTFEKLTRIFKNISFLTNQTTVEPFKFESLFPKNLQYFRYLGSLTTPPCLESIVWTVFKNPIYISEENMKEFRKFHEPDHPEIDVDHSYRPKQPLYNRTIQLSPNFEPSTKKNSGIKTTSSASLHILLLVLYLIYRSE